MSGATSHELTVPPEAEGERLDVFLGGALQLSRAKVKALMEEGQVRVEGRRAKKGDRVSPGQRLTVTVTEEQREVVAEAGAALVTLYLDDALIVVDKPSGRPSHPLAGGETGTVANAVIARFPECGAASEDPREAGLCHRLDIETSGALLVARTRAAWRAMRDAFQERRVDKRYWALVTGPLADAGEIDLPLRHHPRHADRVEPAVGGDGDAREALSRFRVLGRHGEVSLVEVQILTGVLHQVRAHLAAVGAPIVGDGHYGGRPLPALGRFFLHARSLGFDHPTTGERVHIVSPLPPELSRELASSGIAPRL